ncbi:hypothetical protein GCM10022409_42840 [Hymenobacter glaciei]|uniref:DUF4844 domain-containing protein n=1 Tax=Hymenobacter glaciei TaxID=877209 RepID=A0ABP7USN4_9BACT
MKKILLFGLLSCAALAGNAQSANRLATPAKVLAQLERYKDLTKHDATASGSATRSHSEVRPEINRLLVQSADEFAWVAAGRPTREAYLRCIDEGLARLSPYTRTAQDRQVVAEFYLDLMNIVGLETSEGRLNGFVAQVQASR